MPASVGLWEKVTVSEVGVAAVTVPAAGPEPSVSVTESLATEVSKPKPSMVIVVALAGQTGRAGWSRRE